MTAKCQTLFPSREHPPTSLLLGVCLETQDGLVNAADEEESIHLNP